LGGRKGRREGPDMGGEGESPVPVQRRQPKTYAEGRKKRGNHAKEMSFGKTSRRGSHTGAREEGGVKLPHGWGRPAAAY